MSMLVPPQMMNTMVPTTAGRRPGVADRGVLRRPGPPLHAAGLLRPRTDWPSHPHATRDSLHEHDMWAAEGLTHRYPTKVLAELLPTCPQYCGHCTRMDLVGNSTAGDRQAQVRRQAGRPARRRCSTTCAAPRRCATSWSPAATWPTCRGRGSRRSSTALLEIENIRDIRLATKALMGLPQHWLQDDVASRHGPARPRRPASAACRLAIHTHVNHANSVTPLVAEATAGDARHRHPRRPQPGRAAATASTPTRTRCSTCASRCSTARRSCPTTSTCAT